MLTQNILLRKKIPVLRYFRIIGVLTFIYSYISVAIYMDNCRKNIVKIYLHHLK
jgi:hypothetical protein